MVVVVVVVPEAVDRGLPMLMLRLVITGRWTRPQGSAAGSSARSVWLLQSRSLSWWQDLAAVTLCQEKKEYGVRLYNVA